MKPNRLREERIRLAKRQNRSEDRKYLQPKESIQS